MDFPFSEDFKNQVKVFNLKYKCADCVNFNEPDERCSFDYPMDGHRLFYVMDYGYGHLPRFSFCKHFELN